MASFSGGSFSSVSFSTDGDSPQPPVVVQVSRAGVGRRRLRSYVELEGQLVEVSDYEEAERLLNELKTEEKAQEKDRKRLTILLKAKPTVGIYRAREQIQTLEVKMDDRASRIEALATVIQQKLDESNDINEDDEEVMLLQ